MSSSAIARGQPGDTGLRTLNGSHWFVLAIASTLQTIDGFDLAAISFAAVGIAKQWHLSPVQLGFVLAAAQFGSIIGAAAVGPLVARFGRKPTLLVVLLAIGVTTLMTGMAAELYLLMSIRTISGLGLGILSPLVIGYGSEFMPARARGISSSMIASSLSVGTIIGGMVAAAIIPAYGWAAIFYVGGAAPLIVIPLALLLPPSLIDLRRNSKSEPRLAQLEQRFEVEPRDRVAPVGRARRPLAYFFSNRTLMIAFITLAVGAFLSSCVAHFLNTWLPAVLEKDGAIIAVAALSNSVIHAGGLFGNVWFGSLMDRFKPYWVNAIVLAVAAIFLVFLGLVPPRPVMILIFCAITGVFVYGATYLVNAFASVTFDTDVRVAAIGYLTMFGRLAGVIAPLAAGVILSLGGGRMQLFSICAALLAADALLMVAGGLLSGRADCAARN